VRDILLGALGNADGRYLVNTRKQKQEKLGSLVKQLAGRNITGPRVVREFEKCWNIYAPSHFV
jgi:hypothetical protein